MLAIMSPNVSTPSLPTLPSSRPSSAPSRSSRRKHVENWDNEYEIEVPSRRPSSTAASLQTSKTIEKRRLSPAESWTSELWDESPPRAPTRVSQAKKSTKVPSPLNLHAPVVSPPRLSPSQTLPLTSTYPITPVDTASTPNLPFPPPPALTYSQLGAPLPIPAGTRSRSTSTAATVSRNKLIKRHPSVSTILISTALPLALSHKSSSSLPPALPRSDSGERMPPPPLPSGLSRSKSKSKPRASSRDRARVSSIPFSPSQEGIRQSEEVVKRPGFWKRLSGAPSVPEKRGELSFSHTEFI